MHRSLTIALLLALFGLIVVGGVAGNESPFKNIAPVMVWVIFWVGFSIASALLGDVWAVVNPWKAIFIWAERLDRRLRPGGRLSLDVAQLLAVSPQPTGQFA